MGWFDKYCEVCGMKVDKSIQRFGKYFCSQQHAEQYTKTREEHMKNMPQQESRGGCC